MRARGGPLHGLILQTDNHVFAGMPGAWQCTRYLLAPDQYGWRIVTAADPIYLLFDGDAARTFVGTAEVGRDGRPDAPLRSHARWTAVANLDALRGAGVVLSPLPAAELPQGVREGLAAELPDGARYRLGFDQRTWLIWLQGPLDLSPFSAGEVTARFTDQPVDGRGAAFPPSYSFGPLPIFDESVRAACIDPAVLDAGASATRPCCPAAPDPRTTRSRRTRTAGSQP